MNFTKHPSATRRALLVLASVLTLSVLLCWKLGVFGRLPGTIDAFRAAPPGRMEVASPTTPAASVYSTVGTIEALPGPTVPYLIIRHEPINDFKDRDGMTVGMPGHAMEFPTLHPSVDLASLRDGEKVDLTFEVRWGAQDPRSLVIKLTPR